MSDAATMLQGVAAVPRAHARVFVGPRPAARSAYALAAPAFVLMLMMLIGPLAGVIALRSPTTSSARRSFASIGLSNYHEMFADRVFWISLKNTLIYVAIVVPGSVALGLGTALLIESGRRPARALSHRLFPSGDGDPDRDGDRLGIHAASAVRRW